MINQIALLVGEILKWQVVLFSFYLLEYLLWEIKRLADRALLWFILSSLSSRSTLGRIRTKVATPSCPLGQLISPLPDEVVESCIWPKIIESPSVLQLLVLRSLSSPWRHFIERSPQWKVLTFLWTPDTGLKGYLFRNRCREGMTPDERLAYEMRIYELLMPMGKKETEGMGEEQIRDWYIEERSYPPFILDSELYYYQRLSDQYATV